MAEIINFIQFAKKRKNVAPVAPKQAPKAAKTEKYTPKEVKRGESQQSDQRKCLLGKIHMAVSGLTGTLTGFNEDTYRYYLSENFTVRTASGELVPATSAKTLTINELEQVKQWLADLGYKYKRGAVGRTANKAKAVKAVPATLKGDVQDAQTKRYMQKIEALLAGKGRVEKTFITFEYAAGILAKQTKGKLKHLDQASPRQLQSVIAALTKDAERKGRTLGR